ncbi:hypothetical protein NOF04DRAFT_1350580 [Fusarium oxysporum II5]|nr:hypothetical protein NOF04DRAFT_1350580 [Fusarium oxysporum II5]
MVYLSPRERLHDQTRIHLQDGYAKTSQKSDSWIPSIPISIASVQSLLINLKLHTNALNHSGITNSPTLLSQSKTLSAWRFYTAPLPSAIPTPEHVGQAHRAAKSLCNRLILFSKENAKHLGDLHTGKSRLTRLSILAARQEMHTRYFKEISKAIKIFQQEMTTTGFAKLEAHTILPMRLFHTTSRQIINLDPTKTRGISYTPQLFLVAHSSTKLAIRQRAISLLRHPRLDSRWDSLISASIAEEIMDRERESALQYLGSKIRRQEEDETDPMFRIFNFTFAFRGSRKAQTVLRTWYEILNEIPGQVSVIQW